MYGLESGLWHKIAVGSLLRPTGMFAQLVSPPSIIVAAGNQSGKTLSKLWLARNTLSVILQALMEVTSAIAQPPGKSLCTLFKYWVYKIQAVRPNRSEKQREQTEGVQQTCPHCRCWVKMHACSRCCLRPLAPLHTSLNHCAEHIGKPNP